MQAQTKADHTLDHSPRETKNKVLLVDQRDINLSFGCVSVFLNSVHIIDGEDEDKDDPIACGVAEAIAEGLQCSVSRITLSEKELAYSIAKSRNELDEFDPDDTEAFDDWISGYTNENVLTAAKDQQLRNTINESMR